MMKVWLKEQGRRGSSLGRCLAQRFLLVERHPLHRHQQQQQQQQQQHNSPRKVLSMATGGSKSTARAIHTTIPCAARTTRVPIEPFYGSPRPEARKLSFNEKNESVWDRWNLLLEQALVALRDPTRADAVAAVGELTGKTALQHLQSILRDHPTGREILRDRPLVRKETIPYDRLLHEARALAHVQQQQSWPNTTTTTTNTTKTSTTTLTFGQAYGLFLLEHGYDPDERDEIRFMPRETPDDDELAYILLRYRQSHDFFHALTGLPPTVLGELGLKWLELFQTGLPLAAFSATIGSMVTLSAAEQRILVEQYLPWALRMGRQMPFGSLLTVYYEREWDTPLVELRTRLGLEPAPIIEKQ